MCPPIFNLILPLFLTYPGFPQFPQFPIPTPKNEIGSSEDERLKNIDLFLYYCCSYIHSIGEDSNTIYIYISLFSLSFFLSFSLSLFLSLSLSISSYLTPSLSLLSFFLCLSPFRRSHSFLSLLFLCLSISISFRFASPCYNLPFSL